MARLGRTLDIGTSFVPAIPLILPIIPRHFPHPITPHTPRSAGFLPQFTQTTSSSPIRLPRLPRAQVLVRYLVRRVARTCPWWNTSPEMITRIHTSRSLSHRSMRSLLIPVLIETQLIWHARFGPLSTASGIESSTASNEGSQFLFQHAQQHLYKLYRPYKIEPSDPATSLSVYPRSCQPKPAR